MRATSPSTTMVRPRCSDLWCQRKPAEVLLALCKGQQRLVLWERRQPRHRGLEMAGKHWCSVSACSKMRPLPRNQAGQLCSAPCLLLLVLTAPADLGTFTSPNDISLISHLNACARHRHSLPSYSNV